MMTKSSVDRANPLGRVSKYIKNRKVDLNKRKIDESTKLYNRTHTIVGFITIFILFSVLMNGIMSFFYLKNIDSLDLLNKYLLSGNQIAPVIILLILYSYVILSIPIPFFKSDLLSPYNNQIGVIHKLALIIINILDCIVIYAFFNGFEYSILILTISAALFFSCLSELRERCKNIELDMIKAIFFYISFTFIYILLIPFSSIITNGKELSDTSDKEVNIVMIILLTLGLIGNLIYVLFIKNWKNKDKLAIPVIIILLFILTSMQPFFPNEIINPIFRAAGIQDVGYRYHYMNDDKFIKRNDINIDNHVIANGTIKEGETLYCVKVLWRQDDIVVFEFKKKNNEMKTENDKSKRETYRIEKNKLSLYQSKNSGC